MYKSLPFLKQIDQSKMRITPETEVHLTNIVAKKLQDNDFDLTDFGFQLRSKLTTAIKNSIYNGYVVASSSSMDKYNPKDPQLEIYVHLKLKEINTSLNGTAKFRVMCRLSATNGTLTIRNISRNFTIEK